MRKVGLSQKAVGTLTPRLRQLLGEFAEPVGDGQGGQSRSGRFPREPRFTADVVAASQALFDLLRCVGGRKAATTAYVALAWLLAQKPRIGPIRDATKLGWLKDNLGAVGVELTAPDLAEIECAAGALAVGGERFPPALLATTAPLMSDRFQVVRGGLAGASVGDDLVGDLLPFIQVANSSPFDRADMDEYVGAARVGLNESEAFCRVEPFHSPSRHVVLLSN